MDLHVENASGISRQAVVIIHGIGEQRPMETLRAFVRGALGMLKDADRFYSKPDHISDTLELRRLAAFTPDVAIPTDFYELYWAHLMEGTTWRHVAAWSQMLMLRRPRNIPARLKGVWSLAWIALAATTAAFAYWRPAIDALLATGVTFAVVAAIVRWVLVSIGLDVVGDAARYLSPTPANIRVRHAIRSAALTLLRGLHADSRYERIIIVGHSLGSVIAYDALTYLWQESHSLHGKHADPQQPLYAIIESRTAEMWERDRKTPGRAGDLAPFRALQRALGDELRGLGVPWRITDLVTLGSPLTYGPLLLASSNEDFKDRKTQRELPTCPPQLNDRRDIGFLSKAYTTPLGERHVQVLHHAALFACTRWTNIHYPADPIGGPLAHLFGPGVWDLEAVPESSWSRWPTAHTRYWHPDEPSARATLARALDLADTGTAQAA